MKTVNWVLCASLVTLFASCKLIKTNSVAQSNGPSRHRPLVLMYHDVIDTDLPEEKNIKVESGDVTAQALEAQLKYLKTAGYETVSNAEAIEILLGGTTRVAKPVLITFDDGYSGQFKHAVPLLKANNQKAVFFVHTAYVGVGPNSPATSASGNLVTDARNCSFATTATGRPHMDWDTLRDLQSSKLFEIESHTASHLRLSNSFGSNNASNYTSEQQAEFAKLEMGCSRKALETHLGGEHASLAYPYGAYNAVAMSFAKQYYKSAHAIAGALFPTDKNLQVPRIDIGKNSESLERFKCRIENWQSGGEVASC